MIISLVNQKGGVGKTTAAINIAAGLKRKNHKVMFIDADPQGSATQWHAVEGNNAFDILHRPEPVNRSEVEALAPNYDFLVIDAPPALGDISKSVLAVSALSIIPLSPSALDIWSCRGTIEMIEEVRPENPDMMVKLLINRKIPGTRVGREARSSLEVFKSDVFDTALCQRVAYVEAMSCGVSVMQYAPKSKAADEIEHLCDEILLLEKAKAAQIQSQDINYEPQMYSQGINWESPETKVNNPIWMKEY